MGVFVFGYGSLMWNPGFRHNGASVAVLHGWHRAWCVRSTFYRGCEDTPGVVLGLKRGGSCVGMLFSVERFEATETLAVLDQRETREKGYRRDVVEVKHPGGHVPAFTYTTEDAVEPGEAAIAKAFELARGTAGSTMDYVNRTRRFLEHLVLPTGWDYPVCSHLEVWPQQRRGADTPGR